MCVCVCLTYEHLSFTLCNYAAMFISYFHRSVHQRSPKRHKGLGAERRAMLHKVALKLFNVDLINHLIHSLIARLQDRFWYFVAAGPAGNFGYTVDIVDVGFVVLVPPAPQQSRRGAGLSTESQHPQRGARREHLLFEDAVPKADEQSRRDLSKT